MGRTRRATPLALGLLGALALVLGVAPQASAHALPQSSDPPQSAHLAAPPARVVITYNDGVILSRSSIQVTDCKGKSFDTGPLYVVGGNPAVVAQNVSIPQGANGTYAVTWVAKDASDGHTTNGLFGFAVGSGASCALQTRAASAAPDPLLEVPLTADFLGYTFAVGPLLFLLVTVPRSVEVEEALLPHHIRTERRVLFLALVAAAVATVGTLGSISTDMAGSTLQQYLATRTAGILLARVGLFALTVPLTALAWLWTGPSNLARSPFLYAAAATATAGGLTFTLLSHAWQSGANWVIATDFVHVLAGSAWVGGLAALLVALPRAARPEALALRFSTFATIDIVLVVGTGVLSALAHLSSVNDLLGSLWGQTLLVKAAIVVLMLLFGGANKFFVVPRIHTPKAKTILRRMVAIEMTAGFVVLAVTGALASTGPPAPPVPPQLPFDQTLRSQGNFCASTAACGDMRVRLRVDPNEIGINVANVTLTNVSTGAPVGSIQQVQIFNNGKIQGQNQLNIIPMSPVAPGKFTANLTLPEAGVWNVTIYVTRSTELPDAATFELHV
jgi:copper transport protein